MPSTDFVTWNPVVHFEVASGTLPSEELVGRTLGISYVDRDREFDFIEWRLDNRDGVLTRPEYLALGLMVKMKLGYIDDNLPPRVFIINRIRGGVGVYGRDNAPVGSNESVITFHGRNRNAVGGKVPNPKWSNTAKAPRKAPKPYKSGKPRPGRPVYRPTTDVTSKELVLSNVDRPKIIKCYNTSDGVREIARRNGFTEAYQRIQDTNDYIEQIVIPQHSSDGAYLAQLAKSRGWMFKIEGDLFRWHHSHWGGAETGVIESFRYAAGPDILKLDIDADFRLPMATTVTAKGYDFQRRVMQTKQSEQHQPGLGVSIGTALADGFFADEGRRQVLTRKDVIPVIGNIKDVKVLQKAVDHLMQRHMNAFQINVTVVGNPRIRAGKLLELGGTGSPFVDGIWYISEAKHDHDGRTYTTSIHLKVPPKLRNNAGILRVMQVENVPQDEKDNQLRRSTALASGAFKQVAPPKQGLR